VSQQTPYGPASGSVQSPDYPHGQPAPGYAPAPQRTNVMAILGLVFAFVFSPLGIVFSAIGLSQTKKRGEGGRGLAITGLVLSIVFTLIGLLLFFFVFAAVTEAVESGAVAAETEAAAPAEESLAAAPADPQGVLAACEVIAPALGEFDAGVATVSTPEEYALLVTDVRTTIEGAAAATTDPTFVQDVQTMSNNLQLTADAISNGEDPTYLDAALTEDDVRVGEACTAAGF
jgi:Domain of unknown function (DUF4190)